MASFDEIQVPDGQPPAGWESSDRLPPGLKYALTAGLGALISVLIPYAWAPDTCSNTPLGRVCARDLQVWVPGDPAPFSQHFRTDGVAPGAAEASGGLAAAAKLNATEERLLAETADLDDEAGRSKGAGIHVAAPAPANPDGGASPQGDARGAAETSQGPDAGPTTPPAPTGDPVKRIVIPPTEYDGIQVAIEDPNGAMRHFYGALAQTALGRPGAVTRISHWGDSTIAADGLTSVARQLLQRQLGDAGHGYVLVEPGTDWYVQKGVEYERKGWRSWKIIDAGAKDSHYGYGGVSALGYLGAWARYATAETGPVGRSVSRFELYFARGRRYGKLSYSVDGAEPTLLDTRAEALTDAFQAIAVPDGPHELKIRSAGDGPVRVYGVTMERAGPGVVYDCIGLVGARGSRMLNMDPTHFKRQVQHRRPDLMVIAFGGNELVDEGMSMTWYRKRFVDVVRLYRQAAPEASCVVMSPIDHGEKYRGRIRTKPDLLKMLPVQRDVALAEGCAFFSIFDAMGGEGSMGRWYRSKPRLGWADLSHVTRGGARVLGSLWYKALMKGFSDYIANL